MTQYTRTLEQEIARVETTVVPVYDNRGAAGAFSAAMVRMDLRKAKQALAENNTHAQARSLVALRSYQP